MSNSTQQNNAAAQPVRHDTYVPGYVPAKIGMVIFGIILFLLSLERLVPLARLGFTGGRARAEAERIVRTDAAGQETVLASDADVLAAIKAVEEARDHTTTFWVEYRFTTPDGRRIETRSPLGQHMKPLQPIRDRDGLPSTIHLWYDKNKPERIALPFQYGTWFMPSVLALFGILGTFMGAMLLRHAGRPIEMPDLSGSHAEADPAPARKP